MNKLEDRYEDILELCVISGLVCCDFEDLHDFWLENLSHFCSEKDYLDCIYGLVQYISELELDYSIKVGKDTLSVGIGEFCGGSDLYDSDPFDHSTLEWQADQTPTDFFNATTPTYICASDEDGYRFCFELDQYTPTYLLVTPQERMEAFLEFMGI